MNIPNEEIAIAPGHFGVRNMDHVFVDVEIDFRRGLEFALETARAARPHDVLHLVLCDEIQQNINKSLPNNILILEFQSGHVMFGSDIMILELETARAAGPHNVLHLVLFG